MKKQWFKYVFIFLIGLLGLNVNAQSRKSSSNSINKTGEKHPNTFNITKMELGKLFSLKANDVLSYPVNKYLDKAMVLMNTKNGDIKFLKAKLKFFPKSTLLVQVNGEYTTQIFIMSEDKSVFYKAKAEKDKFVMSKCSEDEIVSE